MVVIAVRVGDLLLGLGCLFFLLMVVVVMMIEKMFATTKRETRDDGCDVRRDGGVC